MLLTGIYTSSDRGENHVGRRTENLQKYGGSIGSISNVPFTTL